MTNGGNHLKGNSGDEPPAKPTQASLLVELAEGCYWFGISELGEPFAVPNGEMIARAVRGSGSLRAELAARFVEVHGRVPSSSALVDALTVLEGRALAGPRCQLALRVGRDDLDRLVLDLGNEAGHVAVIGPEGWSVTHPSPILFRRTALTGPLPYPAEHGDLDRLRHLVNIGDDDWPLLLAWLVAALVPEVPHPIAGFLGRQGSAKTTSAKHVAAIIDPSAAQTRTPPREVESWVIAAAGSWAVVLDNVSKVPPWLSDALCRAVTGDALVRRKLYSDGDLSVVAFRRVIAITSIDPGALAGDLAERLVAFDLPTIGEGDRRHDQDVTERFARDHPAILAGLLDLASAVLRQLEHVQLDRLPRMADFARLVAAVDLVLGTDALGHYLGGRARIAEDVIDADPVAAAIRDLVTHDPQGWVGSSTELLDELSRRLPDPDRPARDWPSSPRAMAGVLARTADALALVGIEVAEAGQDPRTRRKRYRIQAFRSFDASQGPQAPDEPTNPSEAASEASLHASGEPSRLASHRNTRDRVARAPSEASKLLKRQNPTSLSAACSQCSQPATAVDVDGSNRCPSCVSWADRRTVGAETP